MTVHDRSPYAVLGLTAQATPEQIRRAYRTLVRENHPDTKPAGEPPDDAESAITLQQVIAAYSVVGDPVRRAAYDHHATPPQRQPSIPSRTVRRSTLGEPQQSPIQAGPVLWRPG